MKFLSSFELFEARPTSHFKDRFELRAQDVIFESGVDGLRPDELEVIKYKVLEIWNKSKDDLEKYDLEWNKGYRDEGYVFNFGDIVVKKGENYYYPVFKVPKEKNREEYHSGSIMCAICWENKIVTLLIFPRICKYVSGSSTCKDPLNHEMVFNQFKRDKVKSLQMENRPGDPFNISFGPTEDKIGRPVWKNPKVNLIILPTEEQDSSKEKKEAERNLILNVSGFVTVKKITPGKTISFQVKKEGLPPSFVTRYIKSHRNIGGQKNFSIEVILSQTPDGTLFSKKTFVPGDQILIKISSITKNPDDQLALELGYTHYLAEIQRYSVNKEKEGFFSCRIIKPVIYKES